MDLIKRDSEHTKYKKNKQTNKQNKINNQTKKLTNRFSNDIGHLISDKVRLN